MAAVVVLGTVVLELPALDGDDVPHAASMMRPAHDRSVFLTTLSLTVRTAAMVPDRSAKRDRLVLLCVSARVVITESFVC
jgi:hypothetical protein